MMRPLHPSQRSLNLLNTTVSRISCPACHPVLTRPSISTAVRAISSTSTLKSDDSISFTEKLRRKIWGTDSPPGQADPYSKDSLLDRTNRRKPRRQATRARAAKAKKTAVEITSDSTYVPATTWDGLEEVGDYEDYYEAEWTKAHQFEGFLPSKRLSTAEELTTALRRAAIEIFTLHQAGRDLSEIQNAPPVGAGGQELTASIQITLDLQGQPILSFPNDDVRSQILESLTPKSATVMSAQPAAPIESPSSSSTTTSPPEMPPLPLSTPSLIFALSTRLLALTGTPLPDPLLNIPNLTTAHIRTHLLLPFTKPAKVADALLKNETLMSLPNVRVETRRVTPIDRHVRVGRWKEIVKELEDRGLPVTGGHASEMRNRQRKQYS